MIKNVEMPRVFIEPGSVRVRIETVVPWPSYVRKIVIPDDVAENIAISRVSFGLDELVLEGSDPIPGLMFETLQFKRDLASVAAGGSVTIDVINTFNSSARIEFVGELECEVE